VITETLRLAAESETEPVMNSEENKQEEMIDQTHKNSI
jgi:hypothetical protein